MTELDEHEWTLALLLSPGIGARSVSRWLRWRSDHGGGTADFVCMPETELLRRLPEGLDGIAHFLDAPDAATVDHAQRLARRVRHAGASFVLLTDTEYPPALSLALGSTAPPLLTCAGNLDLLQASFGGIVGTRTPSESGQSLAARCAEWFAANAHPVVSGGAQGVDSIAHGHTLRAGGETLVVLPQGLLTYRMPGEFAEALDAGAATVLSEFAPDAPWSTPAAITRNTTIAALSRMVCVIEARETGGSIRTARESLRLGRRVLVYGGAARSVEDSLVASGAHRLLDERGEFDDEEMTSAWRDAAQPSPEQPELF